MDRLPSATSLARAFLALRRAEADGVLEVHAGQRRARVAIVGGRPCAVTPVVGVSDALGDLLAADGAIDSMAHRRALARDAQRGPVGRWLIDTGAASEGAVTKALRVQLRRRVIRLFRLRDTEYQFRAGSSDIGCPHVPEPVTPEELVLSAIAELVAEEGSDVVRRRLGQGRLELTGLGATLFAAAPAYRADDEMVRMLERGATVEALLGAADDGERALRTLFALRLLGAVRAPGAGRRSYQLLIRKQREIRHAVSNKRLLDMSPGMPRTSSRRALRLLAKDLHPDRFASETLKRSSNEVLKELVRAEAEVRSD